MQRFFAFFTDPVLQAPTLGSMLMCFSSALIGTFALLRRQALVGEMLSHACYPGVILALIATSLVCGEEWDILLLVIPMIGALLSCIASMYLVQVLTRVYKIHPDSALCVVLASFFGIGLTLLTAVQTALPTLYKQLASLLFGQAATMTMTHVWVYFFLTLGVCIALYLFYRPIKIVIFDPQYAEVIGIRRHMVDFLILSLIVLAVVIGIRSAGIVLMSAMLIFPAVSALFWTKRLVPLLALSSLFGLVFGFFGVVASHEMSAFLSSGAHHVSVPTGPSIVAVAMLVFLFSSLFSPSEGLINRFIRRYRFSRQCQQENLLKAMWKYCARNNKSVCSFNELVTRLHVRPAFVRLLLWDLQRRELVQKQDSDHFELTLVGMLWARKIVRLHRLWELYLVEYCGVGKDRVHPSAEEMEHIITPEIEAKLEALLHHPVCDPHHQPIPPHEEAYLLLQGGS